VPKLPIVKANKLVRTLLKLGFYKHHQTGSHLQLKHPDGRRTTIPYHAAKEIRRGTLKSILDDVNLSVEEFTKALKK